MNGQTHKLQTDKTNHTRTRNNKTKTNLRSKTEQEPIESIKRRGRMAKKHKHQQTTT